MSVRRVAVLLKRELLQGPKSFIFLWSVVLPIVMSLVLSLVFGTLFNDKPRVGIMDEDSSGLVALARESQSIVLKEYGSAENLRQAVKIGAHLVEGGCQLSQLVFRFYLDVLLQVAACHGVNGGLQVTQRVG